MGSIFWWIASIKHPSRTYRIHPPPRCLRRLDLRACGTQPPPPIKISGYATVVCQVAEVTPVFCFTNKRRLRKANGVISPERSVVIRFGSGQYVALFLHTNLISGLRQFVVTSLFKLFIAVTQAAWKYVGIFNNRTGRGWSVKK